MFGYVRPLVPELKVKDNEAYKSVYCALCHSLGDNFGLIPRLSLSYDFVFLAMLLWDENETPCFDKCACIVSPFRKKLCCKASSAINKAANFSVILSYWKARDSVNDENGIKRLIYRVVSSLLKPSYKKASARYGEFSEYVKSLLDELTALEKEKCPSLDKAADKFALILAGTVESEDNETKKRILHSLLYHVGRWIYITDAVNDIPDDIKSGSYNPIIEKYSLTNSALTSEQTDELKTTLSLSLRDISSAYLLLPESPWRDILENIIYLGMSNIQTLVFFGKARDINKLNKQRRNIRRNI